MAWAAVFAAAILAALLAARIHAARAAARVRSSLAVLSFRDISDEPDTKWLGVALEESLAAELSRNDGVVVPGGDRAAAAERDLGLRNSETLTPEELRNLGHRLDSSLLLTGSYVAVGGQVRVDLALYRADSGELMDRFSDTAPQSQLQEIVEKARQNLRASLHLASVQGPPSLAFLTRDQLASHFYAEGLGLNRNGEDARRAQQVLSQAVQADPHSPQAHAALSVAWKRLGYDQQAASEAQLALDNSAALPLREKLLLQASAYSQLTEYPNSIEALTQLRQLDPQNPEYTLHLADELIKANRLAEAWTMLAGLADANAPLAGDARVPLSLTEISSRRGDLKSVLVYAGQAINLAQASGSRSEQADALVRSGTAWSNLGNFERGMFDLQKAEQLYVQIGDPTGAVGAILAQSEAMQHHDDPGMEPTARRALAAAQQTGAQNLIARALIALGNVQLTHDHEAEAVVTYQQAADIANTIHAPEMAERALSTLATAEWATFRVDAAKEHTQQALALSRDEQSWSDTARCISQLAEINEYLGLLGQAEAGFRESVDEYKRLGQAIKQNDDLYDLGHLLLVEGKLPEAHAVFASIDVRSMSLGNGSLLKTDEARLTAEEGSEAAGESLAAASAASANSINYSVIALELLDDLELRRGDISAARATASKMSVLQTSIPADRDAAMNLALIDARIDIRTGNTTAAGKTLTRLMSEANTLKDKQMQLQIRMAQAYSEKLMGHGTQALRLVEADASHDGYGLIARNAAHRVVA